MIGSLELPSMPSISIRFSGNGVLPTNTRCKEVADVITAVESLVTVLLSEEGEEETAEGITMSLASIEAGSLDLKFSSSFMAKVLVVWQLVSVSVASGRAATLPDKVLDGLEVVQKFVKRRNCEAQFRDSEHENPLAVLRPDTDLVQEMEMSGTTSLIGEVIRVGGVEPAVRLRLPDGKVLSCEASEDVAKDIGHRLYDVIVCKGRAKWDMRDHSIVGFRISEVRPFSLKPVSQAFSELADVMPKTIAQWQKDSVAFLKEE